MKLLDAEYLRHNLTCIAADYRQQEDELELAHFYKDIARALRSKFGGSFRDLDVDDLHQLCAEYDLVTEYEDLLDVREEVEIIFKEVR